MASPTTTTNTIEQYVPYVKYNGGLATNLPVYINSDLTVTGTTTIAGVTLVNLTVTGNTTIGDASTDTLTITGLTTFTDTTTTGNAVGITANGLTTGNALSITSSSALLTSGHLVNAVVTESSATLATRTGSVAHFEDSETGTATSGTISPTNPVLTIKGTMVQNGAGGTLAPSGALLNIIGVSTQTAGTLTDTRQGIAITIPTGMTGAPILFTQGNITTTHFKKIFSLASGTNLWMGDGTTANGALTGTAGDILFNGGSNKPEYCTGTTNWTALV